MAWYSSYMCTESFSHCLIHFSPGCTQLKHASTCLAKCENWSGISAISILSLPLLNFGSYYVPHTKNTQLVQGHCHQVNSRRKPQDIIIRTQTPRVLISAY